MAIEWLLERMAGNNHAPREAIFAPGFIAGESVAQSPRNGPKRKRSTLSSTSILDASA